jgi:hypothetical protein
MPRAVAKAPDVRGIIIKVNVKKISFGYPIESPASYLRKISSRYR